MGIHTRDARVALGTMFLFVLTFVVISGQSGVPNGNWKLNVAKSKGSPSLPFKTATLVIHPVGPATMTMIESVGANGATLNWNYTGPYDGKDVPIAGNPAFDTASRKSVNATTTETTFKKSGKVVAVNTNVLSADGKVLTVTTKGVDERGQPVNSVLVFERQ